MYSDKSTSATAGGENNTVADNTPWPAGGNGYLGHDGGKGMFGVRQSGAGTGSGIISFNLGLSTEMRGDGQQFGTTGLNMNSLMGATPVATVDPFQNEGTINVLPITDLKVWHEFWITIQADATAGGTHKVNVYMDGSTTPMAFNVTAGSGNDFAAADFTGGPLSYLGMGLGATPQMGAVDVDFFAYKEGVVTPGGGGSNGNLDGDTDVDGNDFLVWQRTDGSAATLTAIKTKFGQTVAVAIPEPSAAMLTALAGLALLRRRRA